MANPSFDAVQMAYQTIALEYLQLYVGQAISRGELMNGRFELHQRAPMDMDAMVHNLCYYIAGQRESFEQRWPADWWEALKARFAPAWALKRWPVQEAVFAVDAWRLWQNAPKLEGWKPEYRIVIAKPAWEGHNA